MPRVLVIESDSIIQQLMRHVLDHLYYESVMVSDGYAASTVLAQDDDIALVILNIVLPSTQWMEFLKFLTRHYPHIPTIVTSTDSQCCAEAVSKGAAHSMMNPFRPQELGRVIQRLLQ